MEGSVKLDIRTLSEEDLQTVVDWAAGEGWNPGLHDAEAFYAADPEGFLGAFVGDELAGAVAAVRYDAAFGYIGLFLVPPEHRHLWTGVQLGRAALELLDGRCVATDGFPAQQRHYENLAGFCIAWRNVRHRGRVEAGAVEDPRLLPAAAVPFDALAAYDAVHFGSRRDAFLRPWIGIPDHEAWVWADGADGEDPGIRGFGVLRRCREGARIGPLFADDPEVAEKLFLRLAAADGDGVTLDTPEANPDAVALARRHGLEPVFETARMYRGPDPHLPAGTIFGITSFELG
jgi:GNAT superfamily N-acetyltransferase